MRNYKIRRVEAGEGRLRKRKCDKALRGIGPESVRRPVKKYNGTFEFS
ncbi:MAG: hypothetical protein ACLVAW_19475 [Eisenbergiella massiliensis]